MQVSAGEKSSTYVALVPRLHERVRWAEPCCLDAHVHTSLSAFKGEDGSLERSAYDNAKYQNNFDAAFDVIDRIWNDSVEDKIVDLVMGSKRAPIYVYPTPGFVDEAAHVDVAPYPPTNALPAAFAGRLEEALGGDVNRTIVQAARVGRTDLSRMARFLFQPHFTGAVRTDRPYLLIDDVFTLGGTLAALRSYILSQGGTVMGVSALAHSSGREQPFALRQRTLSNLYVKYSSEIEDFWKRAIGHGAHCLTDAETRHLIQWAEQNCRGLRDASARLQLLRDRLDRARTSGE